MAIAGLDAVKTHFWPYALILKEKRDISLRGCLVYLVTQKMRFSIWEKEAGSK